MIALIQRASRASVRVAGETVGHIGAGVLALICAERGDTEGEADALVDKILSYRIFADAQGKMNRSVRDIKGGLLLVPQFTLAADTMSGTRPSFTPAAAPDLGRRLYERCVQRAGELHAPVASGVFGATMEVELVNDGPVTFWLRLQPAGGRR